MKSERITLHREEHGWIAHVVSRQPVSDDTLCLFQYRCGQISKEPDLASKRIWKQRGLAFDIAAYQVLKEAAE